MDEHETENNKNKLLLETESVEAKAKQDEVDFPLVTPLPGTANNNSAIAEAMDEETGKVKIPQVNNIEKECTKLSAETPTQKPLTGVAVGEDESHTVTETESHTGAALGTIMELGANMMDSTGTTLELGTNMASAEVGDALPTTLGRGTNVARSRRAIGPGAFPLDGQGRIEAWISPSGFQDSTPFALDSGSLVVANMVEDVDLPQNLPQAENIALDDVATRKRDQRTRQFKTKVFVGVILVIALILILVGVLVPGREPAHDVVAPATMSPSSSPTQAPTSMEDYVLSLFPEATALAIIDNPDSPQAQAFQWLLEDSEQLLSLPEENRIKQRFALATLYFATNGDNWALNTNWLDHNIHECEWYNKPDFNMKNTLARVYPGYLDDIYPPTEPPPTTCHQDGLYMNLWLDQNNLVGTLPEELYLLTSLQTLSVTLNPLEGTLSTLVGHLTSLEGLGMLKLQLTGTIPTEIGLLTNLSASLLAGSFLHGGIPVELWELTNLRTLQMGGGSDLQGTIPSVVGTLSKLRWFVLGTIPTEFGQLQELEFFGLYENTLSGPLPSELGQLQKAYLFSLFDNYLDGTLPSELGLLSSAALISLRDNQFTGPIPSEFGLLTNLTITLNARNNQISGTIPTQLGLMTRLQELSFANNRLTGVLPSELGHLTSVGQLALANNSFSNTIPSELSTLQQSLHSLYLEGNPMLSGSIPEALCNINQTCSNGILDECEGPYGLSFDCTILLCGCGCSCVGS